MSGYYVWTVKDGKAVRKDIKVSDDVNSNWVVESGLTMKDDVVVAGIQNITTEGQSLKILSAAEYAKLEKKGKK